MNETIKNAKAIVAFNIREEIKKNRQYVTEIGNCLTQLEISIQQDLKKLSEGVPVESIIDRIEM